MGHIDDLLVNKATVQNLRGEKFINKNLLVRSATTAHDLTATAHDLTVIYTGTMDGEISLPDATADNVGMKIKLCFAAAAGNTARHMGFKDSGTTVLFGRLVTGLAAGAAAKENVTFAITSNAQSLEIDADDETAAGGAAGSTYEFTYFDVNKVFVEAFGVVGGTTATAPDAAASTTSGTS